MTTLTMSYEEYAALPGLRWTYLSKARRSARAFHYAEENPDEGTAAMLIGRAVHAGVLENERFGRTFVGWDGERRGNAWKEFAAANVDREILNRREMEVALGTIKAVLKSPAANEYLSKGVAEQTMQWVDEDTGQLCKARTDLVNGHLIELKTTHDLSPRNFARLAANMGYAEQLAFYRMGLRANRVKVARDAIIIAAETGPPHDVVVYIVAEHVVDTAEMMVRELLGLVAKCREKNYWPGVAEMPIELVWPEWWFNSGDSELSMGGESFEP